jgi:hypothetical protein
MPQSKYGGIPVEDEQPTTGSKYGGIPVDETPAAPVAAAPKPTVAPNKLEELISPSGGPDNFWTSPHGLIRTGLRGLVHGARELMTPGARTEGAADVLEGAGRVIAPAAIGATLPALITNPLTTGAGLVGGGLIGKGAQKGAEAVTEHFGGSPSAVRLAGDVAPLVTGPLLSKAAGRLIQAPAKPLVKSALGLQGKSETFGADPARAVLEETSSMRPSGIAREGQQRITDLTNQLDTAAAKSTATPSLTPARDILSRASGSAAAANSEQGPREIGRMSRQLTDVRPGFAGRTEYPINSDVTGLYSPTEQPFAKGPHTPVSFSRTAPLRPVSGGLTMENIPPGPPATPRLIRGLTHEAGSPEFARGPYTPITVQPTDITDELGRKSITGTPRIIRGKTPAPVVAAEQPASQFLGMKRQFDRDFVQNWNPTSDTKHGQGVARQAYGAMADEFNRAVPGAEQINGRIQSLIPAVDRAEMVSRNAGTLQRAMDRISRPTGALVPALIGRQIGGTPGLLGGLGVPEMISDPFTKMAAARGLYRGGRSLLLPAAQRASRLTPLVTR